MVKASRVKKEKTVPPTIGRLVHFHEGGRQYSPYAALVCYVHGPDCVNIAVFDENGRHHQVTCVDFRQPGRPDPKGPFAEWPPRELEKS